MIMLRVRQTAASSAPMPHARPWRRGQVPQPRSGAPEAQGLMAAITVAAPSQMPSVAKHPFSSTGADTPFAASTTSRIYTSLTDVTLAPPAGRYEAPAGGLVQWPSCCNSCAEGHVRASFRDCVQVVSILQPSLGVAVRGQIPGPQLSQFPTLIEEVGPQVGPLNLIADLVVERPLSLQQTLRMNLGNPVHE
jgi:hypothetical protein